MRIARQYAFLTRAEKNKNKYTAKSGESQEVNIMVYQDIQDIIEEFKEKVFEILAEIYEEVKSELPQISGESQEE